MAQLPSLRSVLDDTYTYDADTKRSHDRPVPRNVLVRPGNFYTEAHMFRKGDILSRPQLEQLVAMGVRGPTILFNSAQDWDTQVRTLVRRLGHSLGLWTNANVYLTPPGVKQSMEAHNDWQCTFILQLHGVKRWKIWLLESLMKPVSDARNVGKKPSMRLDTSRLGPPYMDVELQPGQILYVPRGAVHATAMPARGARRAEPSLHITAGAEFQDRRGSNKKDRPGLLAEELFKPRSKLFGDSLWRAYQRAVLSLAHDRHGVLRSSLDFREANAGAPSPSLGHRWTAQARALMHRVVDDVFDDSEFVQEVEGRLRDHMAPSDNLHGGE